MKLVLQKKYNKCKKAFIREIIKFLDKAKDNTGLVKFAEPIELNNYYPGTEESGPELETINEIQYSGDTWYAHTFFTDTIDGDTEEFWFGLDELSFTELCEIAEKL